MKPKKKSEQGSGAELTPSAPISSASNPKGEAAWSNSGSMLDTRPWQSLHVRQALALCAPLYCLQSKISSGQSQECYIQPANHMKSFTLLSSYSAFAYMSDRASLCPGAQGVSPDCAFGKKTMNQEVNWCSASGLNMKRSLFSILCEAFLLKAAHLNRWESNGLLMQ